MLRAILEGTPASFSVNAYDPSGNPATWEAGSVAMLANDGTAVPANATATAALIGIFADRRGTVANISSQTFLPSKAGQYGDESLFNQPGYGNDLYGVTGSQNNVIPANTMPTTTLFMDETGVNPNKDSRFVTVYIRGGVYQTDQYHSGDTFTPGAPLYSNSTGLLTTVAGAGSQVGVVMNAPDGNGQLTFKLTLV